MIQRSSVTPGSEVLPGRALRSLLSPPAHEEIPIAFPPHTVDGQEAQERAEREARGAQPASLWPAVRFTLLLAAVGAGGVLAWSTGTAAGQVAAAALGAVWGGLFLAWCEWESPGGLRAQVCRMLDESEGGE